MLDDARGGQSPTSTCRATRRDGTPCRAPAHAVGPGGYCWAHDPANADARHAARTKGGKNRSAVTRLDRLLPRALRPLVGTLLDAVDEVREGTLSPQQGAALAALARAAVAVYQVAILEDRVADLEVRGERSQSA